MEILLQAIIDYIHQNVRMRAIRYALLAILFAISVALIVLEWAPVIKAIIS